MLVAWLILGCGTPTAVGGDAPPAAPQPVHVRPGTDEVVSLDGVSVRVAKVELRTRLGNNQYSRRVAPGGAVFAVMGYEVRNDGSRPVSASDVRVILRDGPTSRAVEPSPEVDRSLRLDAKVTSQLPERLEPGRWFPAATGFVLPNELSQPTIVVSVWDRAEAHVRLFEPHFARDLAPAEPARRPRPK